MAALGPEGVHIDGGGSDDTGLCLEADAFRVRLEKTTGRLGFAFRAQPKGLVITAIIQGSPVEMWNRVADSDRRICVGDYIIGCNKEEVDEEGKTLEDANVQAVVEALRGGGDSFVITVRRFGPRWHVEGETADCIERMNYAAEAGMVLELVQPDSLAILDDDVMKDSDMKKLSKQQFLLILIAIFVPNLALITLWSAMGMGFSLFTTFAPASMNALGNMLIAMATFVVIGMYLVDWHKWESKVQRGATAVIVVYVSCIGGILKCRFYPQAPMVIMLFHLPIFIGLLRATALKQVHRGSFYRGIGFSCFICAIGLLAAWLAWMNIDAWDGNNQYTEETKDRLVEKAADIYKEFIVSVDGRDRPIDYEWDCKHRPEYDFVKKHGEAIATDHEITEEESSAILAACGSVKTLWFLLWMAPFIGVVVNLIIATFCAINGTMMDLTDTSRAEKALKQFVLMVGMLILSMWVAASVAGASMRLTSTLMAFCGAGLAALFMWIYFEVGAKLINSTLRQSKIMGTLVTVVTNDWFRACVIIGFNVLIPAGFLFEMCRAKVRRLRKTTTSTAWLTPEATMALNMLHNWQWASIFIKVNWLVMLYWTVSIGVAKITVVFLAWLNQELQSVSFFAVNVIFFWIGYIMFLLPPVPGIPVYITSGIIIAAQARNISVGYVGGIFIAIALSFVLKIAAVCGQYSIGFFMGKSVKIQQLVGVDKVPIRAVERILLRRGLELGKVAVLVGGPDWPTSVLCGILKLNLFQCCLGTVPVLLVSSPCVLAGAFLAGPEDNLPDAKKSVWDALANTALALSGAGQLASGIIAMYYIQEVVNKHSEELAAHRPEHEAVKQLTLAEQDYQNCYAEVVNWSTLPRFWLFVISFSTGLILFSMFIFVFMDEMAFESFQVKDRIDNPEGLNCGRSFGCALGKLVKNDPPIGWFALFLFFLACFLHFVFLKYASKKTSRLMKQRGLETPAQVLAEHPVCAEDVQSPEGGVDEQQANQE